MAGLSGPVGAHCRPNRATGGAITLAGFDIVDLHRFDPPGPLGFGIPHLAGAAERREPTEGLQS